MRREFIFGLILGAILTVPVMAEITTEEITDAEYLINAGYSEALAEDVFMMKNRVSGKPIEPLYETSQNKFMRFCRKFYAYLDPAQDNYEERLHHNIKLAPSATDL